MRFQPTDDAAALVAAFLDHLAANHLPALANAKSLLRKLLRELGRPVTALELVEGRREILEEVRGRPGFHNPNSFRVLASRVGQLAEWACREGVLRAGAAGAERLAMPAPDDFLAWRPTQHGRMAYNALIAEMLLNGIRKEDLTAEFLLEFLQGLSDRIALWQKGWRQLRTRWIELAVRGTLPTFQIPEPPSKKPPRIAIPLNELPSSLVVEIERAEQRMLGARIRERNGRRPYAPSTVALNFGTVRRLLGFLRSIRGLDLAGMTLREALSIDHVAAYVEHTNQEAIRRRTRSTEHQSPSGFTQVSIVRQLAAVVLVGLDDTVLHEQYARFIALLTSKGVESRREAHKDHGVPDDYFRVAFELGAHAVALEGVGAREVERALLIRDSLILALLGLFAHRRSISSGLGISSNTRAGYGLAPLICVPRESTKPGLRDSQFEIPPEFRGLWSLYLNELRTVLLRPKKGRPCSDALWIGRNGEPLSGGRFYGIVRDRCREILGVDHNPHQARKAWSTAFYHWSSGDFLSAAAILDANPQTLMKSYTIQNRLHPHPVFDGVVDRAWSRDDRNCWEGPIDDHPA